MARNLKICNWGAGVCMAPSGANAGSGGQNDDIAEILEKDAKEAVESLEGNFAQGKMPDVQAPTFPGPIAERMYFSQASIVGIQGPVGSGKTTTLLKSRLRRAKMMPRSVKEETHHGITGHWRLYKLLVVRETYRQLWSTTIPSYLQVYPRDLGEWSGGRGSPVTHVIYFEDEDGPIEFKVEFMAFGDNVAASMRGFEATDIWINETDTVPVEVITVGMGRIKRWPGLQHFMGYAKADQSYGQIACDFNAPDEDNWTYSFFHDQQEREKIVGLLNAQMDAADARVSIEFYNQPGYGEPGAENLQNLPSDYYPTQIATMRLAGRGDLLDRLVYNKITYLRVGSPVFQREFRRSIHVSNTPLEPVAGVPLRIGLDQGLKGAAVIAQFIPPFHWRVYAELHFPNEWLMARTFGMRLAALLDERFSGFAVEAAWGDMAGEHGSSTATDENATWNKLVGQAAGFVIRPQRIGTNRITPRLEAVRACLEYLEGGQPGLILDPSMKFAIRGFEARYVWTDTIDKKGTKRKIPDKSFTEANVIDSLQYLLLSEHRADGLSPNSFSGIDAARRRAQHGRRTPGSRPRGLQTKYDILNPYGGNRYG